MLGKVSANLASRSDMNTYAGATLHNQQVVFGDTLDVVAAGLAIVVVRALTARLAERYRRVRHSSPEALAAAGVTIGQGL